MRVDILWLCIGSEFAVLAVSLSLDRRKTDVVQFNPLPANVENMVSSEQC